MPSKKKLSERSEATLGQILKNPDQMVTPSDLASARVVKSYSTISEWVRKEWLPEPHQLPNGRKYWLGREIAAALERGLASNFDFDAHEEAKAKSDMTAARLRAEFRLEE